MTTFYNLGMFCMHVLYSLQRLDVMHKRYVTGGSGWFVCNDVFMKGRLTARSNRWVGLVYYRQKSVT